MFEHSDVSRFSVNEDEKVKWIRLIRSENIGPKNFMTLLGLYKTVGGALENIQTLALKGGRDSPLKVCSHENAVKELENIYKFGAQVVTLADADYPDQLRNIYDCPPVITVHGSLEVLKNNFISIVGSRNASANGCKFAENLAEDIGKSGYIVVSGMAKGIDTAAHKGALSKGTVAVVAAGIDKIYPSENKKLFHDIAKNGAIITEMPFGFPPRGVNFPRRNRLVSGLSDAVVVVEAALRSGSLITARMALEQGREVCAVPGSPMDPRCSGVNKLIKQGACLVENVDDILDTIGVVPDVRGEKGCRNLAKDDISFDVVGDDDLSAARPIILGKLGVDAVSVDEIIKQTQIPANIVLTILLELELSGKLERQRGGKVALIC